MSSTEKARQRKLKRASAARAEARVSREAHAQAEREARLAKAQRRAENAEKAVLILASRKKSSFRRGADGTWIPEIQTLIRSYPDKPVNDLFTVIEDRAPKLDYLANKDRFERLISQPWVREVQSWEPQGKGAWSLFRGLVSHLFCLYPVPSFLYTVFDRRVELGNSIALFAWISRGGSVAKAVEGGLIPTPLTKKMCHEFMQAKEGTDVIHAVREAQVRCFGGDKRLARVLNGTFLGREFTHQEEFWSTVIQWFCGQGMVNTDQIGPMLDYLRHAQAANPAYSMKGRTAGAILKQMEVWHREMRQTRTWGGWKPISDKFPESGLNGVTLHTKQKLPNGGPVVQLAWRIEEIRTVKDLLDEGRAMKHCVYSYGPQIEKGQTAIFRMRQDGMKRLTIEVNRGSKAIVQARGVCNRKADSDEERVLMAWAQKAGLTVSLGRW